MNKEIHEGNIIITKENTKECQNRLKGVEEITGYLSIHSGAKLTVGRLGSIGDGLYIYPDAKLTVGRLESIGGCLDIDSDAKLEAGQLRSIGDGLYIDIGAKLEAGRLRSIGGDLSIYPDAKLTVGRLASIGGGLYIDSGVKLTVGRLRSIGSNLVIDSGAELEAGRLASIGGDLYIYTKISDDLAKRLYKYNRDNKWYLSNNSNEWLLQQEYTNVTYSINGVEFNKSLFDAVRQDKLSAEEVFSIEHVEQRRIAYSLMDKRKMTDLKNYKVLDETVDSCNNSMKLFQFKMKGYSKPFRYLSVVCPSSGREYMIETQQKTCAEAKSRSFGFDNILSFDEEY